MPDYLSPFSPQPLGVNEVHNAGSIVLVGALASGLSVPTTATLTPSAAATAAATSISIASDQTNGTWVRKGSILSFGTTPKIAIVTADTKVLNTATSVPVEPLVAAIATTDTATSWGLLQLLSPINIPLNNTDQSEDRTDHTYGLQGGEVKTKVMAESQIQVFDRGDDRAYNELVQPASTSGNYIFMHIIRSGGANNKHIWGRVQISGNTDDGGVAALSKPQFTAKFQAPYAQPTRYQYETTAKKALMNDVMKLSGLAIYV